MADPTPPAAPRPCGHERLDDDGCCKACGVDIFAPRPVSPEATPSGEPTATPETNAAR
jgi:hypothetical protein